MDNKSELLRTLAHGTELVQALIAGSCSFDTFRGEYGNFYHWAALDGHEADKATRTLLIAQRDACRLHEQVQRILDSIYESDAPLPAFEAAGRVLPARAFEQVVALTRENDLDDILRGLRAEL